MPCCVSPNTHGYENPFGQAQNVAPSKIQNSGAVDADLRHAQCWKINYYQPD